MRIVGILMVLLAVIVSSCRDKLYVEYYGNKPIYMSYDELRNSVQVVGPHAISKKGAYLIHNQTMYVIEEGQGIHIIDNSNPSSPNNVAFIKVLGAKNFTMRNNTLYVNSFIDLVVLNCDNPLAPVEVNRLKDVFPYSVDYPSNGYRTAIIDPSQGVVIGFEMAQIKEPRSDSKGAFGAMYNDAAFSTSGSGGSTNYFGSITTFAANSHHLYILQGNTLSYFGLSDESNPVYENKTSLTRWGETILADENHLFFGTTSGMQIYSAPSSGTPQFQSEVVHIVACDPVAVSGNFAYYTIRSGSNCGGNSNKLEVVDISTITNPQIVGSFDLTNPRGLAIANDKLLVCDGSSGVRCFNATNPATVGNTQLSILTNLNAFDVILQSNLAILMNEKSLVQVDYTNPSNPIILSEINF